MDFVQVFLNKNEGDALYLQLYNQLAAQIQDGRLAAGERLPGKRTAAGQLGVSINTVDSAYQMLAAEGYVESRPRSGFVVARLEQLVPPLQATTTGTLAGKNPAMPKWRYNFSSAGTDPALFPHRMWNRLLREVLADEGEALWRAGSPQGEEALRSAIAVYLQSYRGVRCDASQVVVGAGLEVLTGMLLRLFAGAGVAVEDPGYPKTAHILRNEGLAALPVPVDGDGMSPALLRESGASVAYLTPSHHFPTGAVMPVGRRTELLQWASGGNLIIEDDYDSEFRFDGRPVPCLQGLDGAGSRVVYMGTFSRSLAPGLRAAYLVLPRHLLAEWRAAYGDYACTVSRPEQHTLARLMAEGHFARSVNRARLAYRQRRDALIPALKARLQTGSYHIHNRHTGLYFTLQLPGQNTAALAKRCRANGLRVHALEEYYQPRPQNMPPPPLQGGALVLGYGGLSLSDIDAAAEALCAVINAAEA